MRNAVINFQECIHYEFRQVKLLSTALTHSSYANEREDISQDNERLEFLGDAVLELTISEELILRYPEAHEGHLTRIRSRLVKEKSLADIARELKINEYLMVGRGEEIQGGRERDSLLSDALEAVFGAVFLDGGYNSAKKLILSVFDGKFPPNADLPGSKDYKSKLQEETQRLFKDRPVYVLADSSGPEHDKRFTVTLTLPQGDIFTGIGMSLKKAEQTAAGKALEYLLEKYSK